MPHRTAPFASFLLFAACASGPARTAGSEGVDGNDPKPIAQLVEATRKPEPIGMLLSNLDNEIRAWNNLFLAAQSETDRAKARNLELAIMTTAHNRRPEIVEQLEAGPLNNRIVAAIALGFTRDADVQSPLLAALDDTHPEVVSNALLGLWLLGRTDTPLGSVALHLSAEQPEDVRTNASLCLSGLVGAGARDETALPALRLGLIDRAPAVRAHCAVALAEHADGVSFQAVVDLLQDATPFVVRAAARSVAHFGAADAHLKGKAARALVGVWSHAKEPVKGQVCRAMIELAGANYGSDEKEWTAWAARLP